MANAETFLGRLNKLSRSRENIESDSNEYKGLYTDIHERERQQLPFASYMELVSRLPRDTVLLRDIIPVGGNLESSRIPTGLASSRNSTQAQTKLFEYYNILRERIEKDKARNNQEGKLFIVNVHERPNFEHIHVVHNCRYTKSTCACGIMAGLPVIRRQQRFRRNLIECSKRDWSAIAKYYLLRPEKQGGNLLYLSGHGIFNGILDDSSGELERSETLDCERCLDKKKRSIQDLYESDKESDSSQGLESIKTRTTKRRKDFRRSLEDEEKNTTVAFLKNNLITPIEACVLTDAWQSHPDTEDIEDDSLGFQRGLGKFQKFILFKSLQDTVDLYRDKTIYFNAVDGRFNDMYFTIDDSFERLEYLLEKQFGSAETGLEFMTTLYKILTKQNAKQNALWLVGGTSGGKSWFVEPIKSLMITHASTSVLNKTNNFSLSACTKVRLIVLDELNYEPMYIDLLKKLFSGNEVQTPVKFKKDATIFKTPVIVMSNGECLPSTDTFQTRVVRIEWKRIFTEEQIGDEQLFFSKLLHPYSFISYWTKYGVWDSLISSSVSLVEINDQEL